MNLKRIVGFVIMMCVAIPLAISQNENHEVEITVLGLDKRTGYQDLTMEIYEGNDFRETVEADTKSRLKAVLAGGKTYGLVLVKPGFYSKTFIFDTRVEEGIEDLSPLEFDAELVPMEAYIELHMTDPFAVGNFDLPYVIFEYSDKEEDFYFREEYTEHIKQKYKELEQASSDLR